MLHCPECHKIYEDGSQRFCTYDNARLVSSAPDSDRSTGKPKNIFSNILGGAEPFEEQEKSFSSTATEEKEDKLGRKFKLTFEPPKGSRFFKSDKETGGTTKFKQVNSVSEDEPNEKRNNMKSLADEEFDSQLTEREKVSANIPLAGLINPSDIPEKRTDLNDEEMLNAEKQEDNILLDIAKDSKVLPERPKFEDVEKEDEEVAETVDSYTVAVSESFDLLGQTFKNRYQIIEEISRYENSVSYLAKDKIALNKKVVVTVFSNSSKEDVKPFYENLEKVEILAHIKHPNVEKIVDSGILTEDSSYIVTEYINGKNLKDVLRENSELDFLRIADIIRQVSYGLNEIHEHGVIYNNLSPEKIILSISDAGTELAKLLNPINLAGKGDDKKFTYKSPEQLRNDELSTATDNYSLAALAYQMLTDWLPFDGGTTEQLLESQNEGLTLKASKLKTSLPGGVDDVLKRALSFSPDNRYSAARRFGDEFYDALNSDISAEENEESEKQETFETTANETEETTIFKSEETPDVPPVFLDSETSFGKAEDYSEQSEIELDLTNEDEIELGLIDDLEEEESVFDLGEKEPVFEIGDNLIEEDALDLTDPKSSSADAELDSFSNFELDLDESSDSAESQHIVSEEESPLSLEFLEKIEINLEETAEASPLVSETLPEIEWQLEGLDEVPLPLHEAPAIELNLDDVKQTVANREMLPAIELNLDELDKGRTFEEPETEPLVEELPTFEKEVGKEKSLAATAGTSVAEVSGASTSVEIEKIEPTPDEIQEKRPPAAKVTATDYSWILIPLVILLLIAAGLGIWYFSSSSAPVNENIPVENPANQSAVENNVGETNINSFTGATDPESAPPFTAKNPKPPPPPRNVVQPPDSVRYENTPENVSNKKLREDLLGFSVYYPKDWVKNSAKNNYLDITKNAANGTPIRQLLITRYDSTGTFEGDREKFNSIVASSNKDLQKYIPNFQLMSDGESVIQNGRWRTYETKFKGSGINDETGNPLTLWGRRIWVPVQQPDQKSGFVITMLVSSLASEDKGVNNIGIDDDLADIMETFEPKIDR